MGDHAPLPADGHANLLQQVFELWAQPEVERRQVLGTMPRPAQVHAVQVLLRADGPVDVRLNDEVRGIARATADRDVAAGELVSFQDVESLVDFSLEAADDANAGHITAIALPAGWAVLSTRARTPNGSPSTGSRQTSFSKRPRMH
jgi:hypothetical protein